MFFWIFVFGVKELVCMGDMEVRTMEVRIKQRGTSTYTSHVILDQPCLLYACLDRSKPPSSIEQTFIDQTTPY